MMMWSPFGIGCGGLEAFHAERSRVRIDINRISCPVEWDDGRLRKEEMYYLKRLLRTKSRHLTPQSLSPVVLPLLLGDFHLLVDRDGRLNLCTEAQGDFYHSGTIEDIMRGELQRTLEGRTICTKIVDGDSNTAILCLGFLRSVMRCQQEAAS
ncbi:hypothetical protein PROFUN_15304 [Planoprotostelium fungivorum]|uniref:Uncharacterized protein n=1 Tax=Planoprotostelium fungivorum TaxID=1890364 RepID=A0A2P6MX31_9EUKA|nr:hypothetical protein PROFUN_15304 [Planoprotostelium fungivorum]